MSEHLPSLPASGSAATYDQVVELEQRVAERIANIQDLNELQEWRAQGAALEHYLRMRKLHGPMLGAQRRVEARIGQLLGPAVHGGDTTETDHFGHDRSGQVPKDDRADFRTLARALNDNMLTDEQWRASRQSLVRHIADRIRSPGSAMNGQGKKSQRRPLPDAFQGAVHQLDKDVQRLQRLVDDDRFTRNAEQVAGMCYGDLLRVLQTAHAIRDRLSSHTRKDTR